MQDSMSLERSSENSAKMKFGNTMSSPSLWQRMKKLLHGLGKPMMVSNPDFIAMWLEPAGLPEGCVIPVGTMFVVPHVEEHEDSRLPEHSILLAGQDLERELYPELSSLYSHTGGFYLFALENMVKKFIIGFTENNVPIYGDGAVYFNTIPHVEEAPRDIRS